MKIAEKIMLCRKKQGWSQEELAEKLNVSRQSVSKWESGVSTPELDKIVLLSQLFGITTDELLKEENISICDFSDANNQEKYISISLNQATEFLSLTKYQSSKVAFAVTLFILSPLCLILFCLFSEFMFNGSYDQLACALGLVILFLFVTAGVVTMILASHPLAKYEFIEKEKISLDTEAKNLVDSEYKERSYMFAKNIALGVALCILGVIPLIVFACFEMESLIVVGLALLFIIVSLGVFLLIKTGIIKEGYQKLLQIEDYDINKKQARNIFSSIYWPIIVAIYLGYSFLTNRWDISWIIWPVAAVLSGVVDGIQKAVSLRKD